MRTAVLVLGMHRSGTSAVTQLLHLMGLDVGKNLLQRHEVINPNGFWENRHLVEIHDNILRDIGSAWYDFRPLSPQWWQRPSVLPFLENIYTTLQQDYGTSRSIVIKDPRLCRLFPIWPDILYRLGLQTKVLMVLRHPLEVALSLEKRDGITEEVALALWISYVLESELYSRNFTRAMVEYNDILQYREASASMIFDTLDIEHQAAFETLRMKVAKAINSDFRHYDVKKKENREFVRAGKIQSLAINLFSHLSRNGIHASARSEIDRFRSQFNLLQRRSPISPEGVLKCVRHQLSCSRKMVHLGEEYRKILRSEKDKKSQFDRLEHQLQKLGYHHDHALAVIAERDRQLNVHQKELARIGRLHAHALSTLKKRDSQLADAQDKLQGLGSDHGHALAVIDERDRQLKKNQSELKRLGGLHENALATLKKRDSQLADAQDRLQSLGSDHGHALAVIDERDCQLKKNQSELKRLGGLHENALATLKTRDSQLRRCQKDLQSLGYDHGHALDVIKERESALKAFQKKMAEFEIQYNNALGRIDENNRLLKFLNTRLNELQQRYEKALEHADMLTFELETLKNNWWVRLGLKYMPRKSRRRGR